MNAFHRAMASGLVSLAILGCAATPPSTSQAAAPASAQPEPTPARIHTKMRLGDGLYAVLAEGATAEGAATANPNHVVLVDDGRYTGARDEPPRYLALRTDAFVPMILEGAPSTAPDGRGHVLLQVTLARAQQKALEDFTRAHLGGAAAIVLDGEIVSVHKIRTVIDGGKLQITRCSDNACEMLRSKLID